MNETHDPPGSAPPPEEPTTTRERLLEAAGRLFAERGESNVSIRDIAAAAGVRHGGVNYHFRSKSELYLEVLARYGPAGAQVRTGHDPVLAAALETSSAAEARDALFAVVSRLVQRMTRKPHSIAIGLMQHELKRPGGPREEIFRNIIAAEHRALCHVLGLIAPQLSEQDRKLAAMSLMSQCVFLRMGLPIAQRLLGVESFDAEFAARYAKLIVETALNGLDRGER